MQIQEKKTITTQQSSLEITSKLSSGSSREELTTSERKKIYMNKLR